MIERKKVKKIRKVKTIKRLGVTDRNVNRMWARAAARDEAMEVAAEIEKV